MSTILVLNPNTSEQMTSDIEVSAERATSDRTKTIVTQPDSGPESLESFYEYHLATIGLLDTVIEYRDSVDGVVIACYGDPGLYPLKEIFDVPVVGVAEASLATATLLGHRFSILVALQRAIPMMENMVQWYGFSDRLASVEATNLSVLELEENTDRTVDSLSKAGERAKKAGAEVLILGCSGMTGLQERLANRMAVPVIDPVENAVRMAALLAEMDLTQSEAGLYQTPPEKEVRGDITGDYSF